MPLPPRMDRRQALKWIAAAAATSAYLHTAGFRLDAAILPVPAHGYGSDPKLNASYKPGDFWPLTLTEAQRDLTALLCDVIIPADEESPSASTVHVHDFIDEWISAPYAAQKSDREIILGGLIWLEAESKQRFDAEFRDLTPAMKQEICDDICYLPKAKPEHTGAAKFFARFRDLTAGGYYTTPQGMKAIGYIGNVPLASFDGPPPELIAKLGLA